MEDLTSILGARGYDIKGDDLLRARAGKVVAPACNIAPDQAARLSKSMDELQLVARQVAEMAERQFLEELASRPVPPADATGEQRYGPNWEAVEAFVESLADWVSTEDWHHIIAGVLSLRTGPPHPAKQRMKDLKANAVYAAGKKGRELGLDDQIAFVKGDVAAAVQQAVGSATFLQACRALGITQAQAAGPVRIEAVSAAQALVIGADNLEGPFYAALTASFVKQILGAEQYEEVKRDFRTATEELGQS